MPLLRLSLASTLIIASLHNAGAYDSRTESSRALDAGIVCIQEAARTNGYKSKTEMDRDDPMKKYCRTEWRQFFMLCQEYEREVPGRGGACSLMYALEMVKFEKRMGWE